jgi:autotransporter-associated beta strand protein
VACGLFAATLARGAGFPALNIEQRTTEPLMRPNQPDSWDKWIGFLNVFRTNDTWQLWYNCLDTNYVNDQDQRVCYATSSNGVDWVKPSLGRVDYHGSTSNNIILTAGVAGAFVFWDPHTDQYRMTVVRDVLPTPPEAYVVFGLDSSNGIDWVEYPDPIFNLNSDTQTTVFWDGDRYRFYPRMWYNPALPIFVGTRTVGYCESTTFTNFPVPTQVLAPDALDPPNSHYYNNAATKLADDLYVMFISIFENPGAQTQIPHLAVSRNGRDFVRVGHAPVLPLGTETDSFDTATIYVGPGCTPGPRPNTYWFYYVGNTVNHSDFRLPNHGGLGRFLLTILPGEDDGAKKLTYRDGLLTWLRADDLDADRNVTNNPADGTPVAVWKDSNNAAAGYHGSQTNAVKRPIYRTSGGPNNMPMVVFDGTNDFLVMPTIVYSNWTVFTVGRMPEGPTNAAVAFADYGPGAGSPHVGLYRSDGAFTALTRDGSSRKIRADDTNGWSRSAIRSAWVTNAMINYRVTDASNTYTGAGTPVAGFAPATMSGSNAPTLGDLPPATGSNAANLEISEFLMFDHTLSDVDREDVELYLKSKYFPPDTNPAPPVAAFSASPRSGSGIVSSVFVDYSTGTITNRFWDFGDGQTTNTTSNTFVHDYTSEGSYSVTLTATGPLGTNTVTRAGYVTVMIRSLYWDTDGEVSGGSTGTTANGTWGSDAYWNTASAGGSGTFTERTTPADTLTFSAGTDVTGASLITVNGNQTVKRLTVEEGSPTFTGGTLDLSSGFTKTSVGLLTTVTMNSDANLGPVTLNSGTLVLSNAMNRTVGTFTVNNLGGISAYALSVGDNNSLGGVAGNTVKLNGYTPLNKAYPAVLAPSVSGLVLPNNMEWKSAVLLGAASKTFRLTGAVTLMGDVVITSPGTTSTEVSGDIGEDPPSHSTPRKLGLYNNGGMFTLRLSGSNTFSGGFEYQQGVATILEIGRDTAFGTGPVKMIGSAGTATLRAVDDGYGAARVYTNALQFAQSGTSVFDGNHTFSGPVMLNVAGNSIQISANSTLSFTHGLAVTNSSRTLTLGTGAAGNRLIIGPVDSGATNYSTLAAVTINNTVVAAGNDALGTNLATTTFASGCTLGFQGDVNYASAKAITLGGSGPAGEGSRGAIRNFGGTNIFAGPITLSANTTVTNDAGSLTLNGTITDGASAFALTHTGGGVLVLGSSNTYDGATTIKGGVLRLNDSNALPGGIGQAGGLSALSLSGGVLGLGAGDFNRGLGAGVTNVQWTTNGGFAAYGADRIVNLGGASAGVVWSKNSFVPSNSILVLGAADATHMVHFQNPVNLTNVARTVRIDDGAAAVDAKLSGLISSTVAANGGLIKAGNGTLKLTANNTYMGLTSVSNGTLLVDGSQGGDFSVASNAVMGGSGSMGTVSGAGLVSPGSSPGILSATQLDSGAGMDFAFEFTATGSPDYANAAMSSNDVLRVSHATTPFLASLTSANAVNIYFDVPSLAGGESFRGAWYTDNASLEFLSAISNATFNYYIRSDGLSGTNTCNGVNYYALRAYNPQLRVTVARTNEAGTQFGAVDGFITVFAVGIDGQVFTSHGTPTTWLEAYGLVSTTHENADTNDVDGDGMTAYKEYRAGTDPTNSNSVFRILSISADFKISWLGGTNLDNPDFIILRSTNLWSPNPWNLPPVAFPRTNGTGGSNVWTDPDRNLYGPSMFYKLTAPTNTP